MVDEGAFTKFKHFGDEQPTIKTAQVLPAPWMLKKYHRVIFNPGTPDFAASG